MRALQCVKPGELALIDRPRPTPKAGEVLVRIRKAGVCGTDLHIFQGSHPYLAYPRIIGHELAGEIVETGPDCALTAGQHVYVIPYLSCGSCVACRRGKTNCCTRIAVLGVHIDGGMTEFVCLPERNVAPADGLTLEQAALVEFLAIGAHAIRRADPKKDDRVLVVGAGPIGAACMIFARLRGASVAAVEMRPDRLDFCRAALGVDHAIAAGPNLRDALAEVTSGDFFDVVIDATGNAQSMTASFNYVAHGGVCAMVGVVRDTIVFEDPEFHKRETALLACRNATPQDFEEVCRALRQSLVPTASLITHRATLDEAPDQFPAWIAPTSGVIKAMIEI